MKKLLLLALVSLFINATGQQTVLFHENFDLPSGPDSVSSGYTGSPNINKWNDTTFLSTSPTQSYHASGTVSGTQVYFETQSFSTIGANAVYLSFNHIAKIYFLNSCKVYFSINNGANWNQVTSSNYLGNSVNFISQSEFSEASYFPQGNLWQFQTNSTPQPSWWISELFDISSLVQSTSGTGYPQVKLRFVAQFTNTPVTGFQAGWFIDDIKVIGAPCEIEEPKISFITVGSSCTAKLLSGSYEYSPTFSRQSQFNITDNVQVDSVRVVEIVNSGSPQYTRLTNPGNIYTHQFSGYALNDTVKWAVEAYDTCGNIGRFPSTGYYTFNLENPIQKCDGGTCAESHNLIDSFPWKQDFDGPGWIAGNGSHGSNRGSYPLDEFYEFSPSINSLQGWSVNDGTTSTVATGPVGDHTTGTGKYLYSEFTNIIGPSLAFFTLPCIDIRDSSHLVFSFYYHMYGSDIDKIRVDIDTTPGMTPDWNIELKILREQQSSGNDVWKKATINLEPFRGKIVKLRIMGQGLDINQGVADIAIDDIEIVAAPPSDVALFSLMSPDNEPCKGSTGLPVTIALANKGHEALPTIPVAYQLNNGTIVRDTIINTTAGLTDTLTFSFAQNLSFNPAVAHTFKVWSELSGDADLSSDTLVLNIPILNDRFINIFPYFENFEQSAVSSNGIGNLNTTKWTGGSFDTTQPAWFVVSGNFSNAIYGPPAALGINKKALTLKTSPQSPTANAFLISGCIDLTNVANPQLAFQYHMNSSNQFEIMVREEGGQWNIFSMPNPPGNVFKELMQGFRLDLSAYGGKKIRIAFRGFPGNDYSGTIDDILISQKPNTDLALRYVELDRFNEGQTSYAAPKVHFTSWGLRNSSLSYYSKLHVKLINKCDPIAPAIFGKSDSTLLWSIQYNPDGTINYPALKFSQNIPAGEYQAKYWLETVGDALHVNDTAYQDVVCQPIAALPYFNDFEACETDVYLRGKNNQWEVAEPLKPGFTSAHSGVRAAITNADTNTAIAPGTGIEVLELPGMLGLDTLYDAELRLWHNFDFGSNGAYGVVQILDGQFYKDMYNPIILGVNWRNLWSPVNNPNFNYGITGSSNGWVYSSYPLGEFKDTGIKYIRFLTFANGVPGWAVDDIEVFVPPQNSGSPRYLSFTSNAPKAGNNAVAIKIRNTAAAPLDEVVVFIKESGNTLLQEKLTFTSPIPGGNTRTVSLSQPLPLNTNMSELLIYTQRPNNAQDAVPTDDTLKLALQFLPEVDSLPQCFDFENSNSLLAFDPNIGGFDTTWMRGVPAKNVINTAYSGTNAWFTAQGDYSRLLNKFLYTPFYDISDNSCYRLSFWQNFDTEKNFDGGNVEFSLDSGLTWQTLGTYSSTDSLWYNTQYVQSLDLVKPGFSGSSAGWQLAQNEFKAFGNPATIQFRFRFASNADISGEGWAIDDVCLEPIIGGCQTIGLDVEPTSVALASLYPVPAKTAITLSTSFKGTHNLAIYDQRGALLKRWSEELSSDVVSKINIEKLPAGVYWLQIENEAEPIILKFIRN